MKPKKDKLSKNDVVVLSVVAIMIFGMFIVGVSFLVSLGQF